MKPTTKQIEGYLNATKAIADAIREFGSTPAGPLYAAVMGSMSLETFQGIISVLTRAGLVRVTSHLITWTGPTK